MNKRPGKLPPKIHILREMAGVIDIEIEALQSVRDNLNSRFEDAVEMIAASKGQVVVTGVGKSGIIANKIAATLRSTGTPAVFLHASEALHGDMGIIAPDDVVLALGKSGETSELNDLLRFVKKNGTRIVAITSGASSQMARLSDIVLDLKIPREACPLNLAPTASTTAALVVGDAIAVALMKMKNISSEDFARRHPGGQLGRRLLLEVQDVMRTAERSPTVVVGDTVKRMLVLITAGQAGAISVVDDRGQLAGLVSDYDVRRALERTDNIFGLRIQDIMNPKPTFIFSDQKATEALDMMRSLKKPTAVLPVLDRARTVVGMIHVMDLVSAGL